MELRSLGERSAVIPTVQLERTLEIHSDNCQARFIAYSNDDADTETIDVEKCGLCGGDSCKKDNFKDCTLPLMAQVTARNVKRD